MISAANWRRKNHKIFILPRVLENGSLPKKYDSNGDGVGDGIGVGLGGDGDDDGDDKPQSRQEGIRS